jgi:hypothetical protein
VSKKYEDGIWLFKGTEGYTRVRFLKDGHCSIMLSEGGLQAPYPLDLLPWTPIRRVADLDGRPVVEASVIEALAKDISETENQLLGTSLPIEELTDILHERLASRKDENNDEVAALTEFLRKLGVFPCWDDVGIKLWAWKYPGGYIVLFEDGSVRRHTAESFDLFFTRTPPAPLSPELESLIKPLAEKLGKTETEVREALATCAGG